MKVFSLVTMMVMGGLLSLGGCAFEERTGPMAQVNDGINRHATGVFNESDVNRTASLSIERGGAPIPATGPERRKLGVIPIIP
ncbi:MAG: hypothetical protein ACR2G0_03765 [Chthoniobacterales bacterium]